MINISDNRWPKFELITSFDTNDIPSEWLQPFISYGIPKSLFDYYQSEIPLTLINTSTYGQIICFGRNETSVKICLVPQTGEVIMVLCVKEYPITFVNKSLEQFIASVIAVYNRFPFDSWRIDNDLDAFKDFDLLSDEWEKAAQDLKMRLIKIDPYVGTTDDFWTTFLDDLRMGNGFTKDILTDTKDK
jgi:hypothetical protein